jgi:hypothetical protein
MLLETQTDLLNSTIEFALSVSPTTHELMQHFCGFNSSGSLSLARFSIEPYRFGNSTLKLTLPPEGIRPEPR